MRKHKRDYPPPCECGSRRFKTKHKWCDYGMARWYECRACGKDFIIRLKPERRKYAYLWPLVELSPSYAGTEELAAALKEKNISFVIGMDPAREGAEASVEMACHEHVGKGETRPASGKEIYERYS